MRGMPCTCVVLVVFFACTCKAQETPSADPIARELKATPVARTDGPNAPHSIRTLPPDLPPNPPKSDDLQAAKRTWHGEYEADVLGKPLLGPSGQAVPVLYDRKGKRVKSSVKAPKTHPITISAGTLTVDGLIAKARLNYSIPDLRYIYLSAPDVGTVIVSQSAFLGSNEQKNAFDGKTLTVIGGSRHFQLTSDKVLIGKQPESAWVKVDPDYHGDTRNPVVGYGSTAKAPYEWPGAKSADSAVGAVDAPPLPSALKAKLASSKQQAPGQPEDR